MKPIVECVPNFSEGRRAEVVDALAAALTGAGARLLDSQLDAAHNRCVLSVAGEPEQVARGVLAAVAKAVELIDLRTHQGQHPRMGAADVIPFVPIAGITLEECVALSARVGESIASALHIPVYLYEQSARIPERRDLAHVRRGGFEVLRDEIRTNPERVPDFGPREVHPTAGATAVGARFPLIAYNVYLDTADAKVARAVARAVRHSSGGLRHVKALGFEIAERRQVQVSMNLTRFEETPIHRAFELVAFEARRYGARVVSSEIVGLVPQRALEASAEFYLRLEGFSARQVLENRLAETSPERETTPPAGDFAAEVAAPTATPAGGSVSAHTAALAAALGQMVAGVTRRNPRFHALERRMSDLEEKLAAARAFLEGLVRRDAAAYDEVMRARKLPKSTAAERARRADAVERATRAATEVPLEIARAAGDLLPILEELLSVGSPSARSDAATGVLLAFAALKGARYNVLSNLPGLSDTTYVAACRAEIAALSARVDDLLPRLEAVMKA
jgi:glutamate formiminotransferase/formiminotetrahydrofolate cyclodeaminase